MSVLLLIAVAAFVLFWPVAKKTSLLSPAIPAPADVPEPVQKEIVPSFIEATKNLATVRTRLLKTELLDDEQKEAIDVLQLALTAGSDQQ